MIHGPYGIGIRCALCMDGGSYIKYYPEVFSDDTIIEKNGFVRYRYRNDDRSVTIHGKSIDNEWVVPHKHDLYVNYDTYINIEVVHKRRSLSIFTRTCIMDLIRQPLL